MAKQNEQEEPLEQDDLIRIPPGWGPVIFLAVVIVLSNAGLGLYMRGLVQATPTARPVAIGKAGGGAGAGAAKNGEGPGGAMGGQAMGGQAMGGQAMGASGAPRGGQGSTFEADESEFTDELEAYIKGVAEDAGLAPDVIPSAKEIYEQMKRSGLLPRTQDIELKTVIETHVREMGKHAVDGKLPGGGPGGMGAPPEGGPGGMGAPPEGGAMGGPGGPGAMGGSGGSPGAMQAPGGAPGTMQARSDMKPPIDGQQAPEPAAD